MTKKLRQALILLHVLAGTAWATATLVVLLLTAYGERGAALLVDDRVLADSSFLTVYTGLMLAATSNWGFTRFWWVAVKLVGAIGLALGGRALLHDGMPLVGGVLMVAAIAGLAWIGRTKPWGRIRGGSPARLSGHPAVYLAILRTPVLDYVTGLPLQAVPAAAAPVASAVSTNVHRALDGPASR